MLHLLLLNRDYQLPNYSSYDVWSTQDLWWQNLAHFLAPKLPSPIYDDWEQQDPFNILKEFINFCSGYSCVYFTVGQNVVFVWKAPSSVADIKGRLDWARYLAIECGRHGGAHLPMPSAHDPHTLTHHSTAASSCVWMGPTLWANHLIFKGSKYLKKKSGS